MQHQSLRNSVHDATAQPHFHRSIYTVGKRNKVLQRLIVMP